MQSTTEPVEFQRFEHLTSTELFNLELEYKQRTPRIQNPTIEDLREFHKNLMIGIGEVPQLLLG